MKRILLPSIIVGLVISLTLAACSNLPSATKEPETVLPVEEGVDEPPSPEPLVATDPVELEVGSMMRWFDKSILVYVPKGEFIMGAGGDDNLQHTVYLDDFWIYKFKVTNEQYQLCVAAGACSPPADEPPFPDYRDPEIKDRPVIGVDWTQAETYCEWMNARLPTEAEWEKTARGPDGNLYPWGDGQADCSLLNFEECLLARTSDVVDYPEGMSFYEAFDMAGNAYEWVGDWYQADYYLGGANENPLGPDTGIERVIRGSSYKSNAELLPSAQRFYLEPEKYR
jgi:formylglycine-generating enzyme required for sulfatase activity